MSCIRCAVLSIATLALAACATPQVPTWPTGIPYADARAITRLIRTQTAETIVSYVRDKDGGLRLRMSGPAQHTFVVRQIRGQWRIVNEYVIVY